MAAHSFFVALYASYIADLIKWGGPRDVLFKYALLHDVDEIVTGDVVSPVKHNVFSKDGAQDYIDKRVRLLAPDIDSWMNYYWAGAHCAPEHVSDIRKITKMADALDACLFVVMEEAMGNKVVGERFESCKKRLNEALFEVQDIPQSKIDVIDWVEQVIYEHRQPRLYDIDGAR